MFLRKTQGPRTVTLPDGRILTLADLPEATTRWVASRKASVAEAVHHGLILRADTARLTKSALKVVAADRGCQR